MDVHPHSDGSSKSCESIAGLDLQKLNLWGLIGGQLKSHGEVTSQAKHNYTKWTYGLMI